MLRLQLSFIYIIYKYDSRDFGYYLLAMHLSVARVWCCCCCCGDNIARARGEERETVIVTHTHNVPLMLRSIA